MAMVQNHYEINVARARRNNKGELTQNYMHLFATDIRSCVYMCQTVIALTEIKNRFPEPEFKVELTKVECSGRGLDVNKFLEENKKK